MSTIKKLPQYLINQLKAGEIVERPASIVKELIENSLDAGADRIEIVIENGGKKLIQVSDNGKGLDKDDLRLAIERYATSKIISAHDLESIESYGFRGEALASISEVSVFRMQSKKLSHSGSPEKEQAFGIGHELYKSEDKFEIKELAFAEEHGTRVFIENLFHMIPAREKFLKSDATEWRYIKNIVEEYAIIQRDKSWMLNNNGKQIWKLQAANSLLERVLQMTQKSWENKLKMLEFKDEQLHLYGLVGDASLHFPRATYFHIFVNGRPVEDRLLKKAIMDAYQRQIVPGTYPFVVLFVEIDPKLVDVNVHPRKTQVKFLDPGSMFTVVKESIRELIGGQKVNYAAFTKSAVRPSPQTPLSRGGGHLYDDSQNPLLRGESQYGKGFQQSLDLGNTGLLRQIVVGEQTKELFLDGDVVKILGQLWESYIVLEGKDAVYYVDQHAIAERINFEKMRTQVKEKGFETEILLSPLSLEYPANIEENALAVLLENLNTIGFDVSEFGNQKVIVHAIPKVFAIYTVNVELIFNFVRSSDTLKNKIDEVGIFDMILDEILGMKACKASIKAGQRLSMLEMEQLIGDAIKYITGMFVCQHGRPSVVAVRKSDIEGLFERH